MNLAKKTIDIHEMGHTLKRANAKLDSLEHMIVMHLFKVWAYHKVYPESVTGWLKELNAFATQLRRYNRSKRSKPNYTLNKLVQYFSVDPFEDGGDINILINALKGDGYSKINVPDKRISDLQEFGKSYAEYILGDDLKFSIKDKKLLL